MTKEDILEAVALDIFSLEQILDEFFSQNVCIPKGVNRHPYADVLHEALEGCDFQQASKVDVNNWKKANILSVVYDDMYRIKPSEPVYEWLYVCCDNNGKEIARTIFMTYDEWMLCNLPMDYWNMDESSKRVRNAQH